MSSNEIIYQLLTEINHKVNHIMATLQDIANAVTAETSVDNSIVALLNGIVAQLQAAQASENPAAMATVVSNIQANTAILQAAITANTPVTPAASAASSAPTATPVTAPAVVTATASTATPASTSTTSAATPAATGH